MDRAKLGNAKESEEQWRAIELKVETLANIFHVLQLAPGDEESVRQMASLGEKTLRELIARLSQGEDSPAMPH